MTNNAFAMCDAMTADNITIYTVLLSSINLSDISSTIATGYQDHCGGNNGAYFLGIDRIQCHRN